MFRSDFSKYKIYSESFIKTLWQVVGKEMRFQIILSLWDLEVMTDLLCAHCWKIFEQIFTVAYLKKQQPEVICKKSVIKNFSNFTGSHLCWSLFIIKLPEGLQRSSKETLTQVYWGEIYEVFKSTYFGEHLWASACFCIFLGDFLDNVWKSCDRDLWWIFSAKTVNVFI